MPLKDCNSSTTATRTCPSGTSGRAATIASALSENTSAARALWCARSRASGEKSPCEVMESASIEIVVEHQAPRGLGQRPGQRRVDADRRRQLVDGEAALHC